MATEITVGEQAPNFDLTSTEGVVLMLHDEVPRMQVLLYFFEDPAGARSDLEELSTRSAELNGKGIKVMAVPTAPLEELTDTQQKLALNYPLLHDDRAMSKAYGADSSTVLALVDRNRKIALLARQQVDIGNSLAALIKGGSGLRESTTNYPKSVINRLVNRWVN
jgi:peroxiredoxin